MKIVQSIPLISKGNFAQSREWEGIRNQIHSAITQAEWPSGTGSFLIYPESGKKSGQGNGVVPIKAKPMQVLQDNGWTLEYSWNVTQSGKTSKGSRPGDIDAAKLFPEGLVVVEWETGNISSSHRAINKMVLGLVTQKCIAGVLAVPNSNFAQYLTDRIGNIEELRPYFALWEAVDVSEGVLEIIVIEHDDTSLDVPRIPKGKDGRAQEAASKSKSNR